MMKVKVTFLVLVVGFVAACPAAADISVSIQPFYQVADAGLDPFVAVTIRADIPEVDAIVGWGLDLSYDDHLLSLFGGSWASAVEIGAAFDAFAAPDGDTLAGLVPFLDIPLWGDDVLLATVKFGFQNDVGLALVGLSDSNPGGTGDLTEGFALNPPPSGAFATVIYTGGEIDVIPEPAAVMLGVLGLGGLGLVRRRR